MPDATDTSVQDALESALNSDAESQSAKESDLEVADALKTVLETPEDKPGASDDKTVKGAESSDKDTKTVPYERLAQVIKQKNEFAERLKNLDEQFKSATTRETELRSRVGELEQDHQILEAIKNLALDEKYKPHVVAIDKALQGIDDEVEQARESGDKNAEVEALKKFEQKQAELEDLIADQRAKDLWEESDELAKKWLATLPDAYTDEDKNLLSKLWTPRVDWDKIEAEGSDTIPSVLKEAFVSAIKDYGTPKGALVAKTTKEVEERVPEARIVSNEDAVKSILSKEWSKTDEKGNPEYSDNDFTRGMADLLRKVHSS